MPVDSKIRNTYSSQFVPLPLELFARANERDQKIQDEQVASTAELSDGLWKIKGVVPEDQQKVDEIKTGFDQAATQMVHMNLTQKENQKSVKDLIKSTSRDKDLNHIMSVASQYQQWQENVAEAKKAGNYMLANDMGAATYANYEANGGYKSGGGIDSSVFKYEDSEPVRKQFYDDMAKLGNDQMGKVGQTFYKFGFEGISEARVGKQAMASIDSYMNTTAAAQDARMYNLAVRQGKIDPKKMSEGSYIMKGLLATGMERAGMSFSSGEAAARNDDVKTKKADAKEKEEKINLFNGMAGNEIPSTLLDGIEVKYDKAGKIVGDGKGVFANAKEAVASGNYNPIDMYTNWKNDTRYSDDQNTRLKSVIVGAKLNGVSDQKYAEHFNKTWAPVLKTVLTGPAIKANNDAFMNAGAGVWSHMIVSKDGKGSIPLLEALQQSFKNVPDPLTDPAGFTEFLKTSPIQVTGEYEPNLFSAKPLEITINRTTFVADMTNGGRNMGMFKTPKDRDEAIIAQNHAKLNAGQQIEHVEKNGDTTIYYKNLSKYNKETGDYEVSSKTIPKK